jgi:hypothetical protein
MWGWWLSWGWGWGIGVEEIENQMEERESVEETTQRRDGERRREKILTGLRGVKLVMCIAQDQDTCHSMNGEFGGRAPTRVGAKLCPKNYT